MKTHPLVLLLGLLACVACTKGDGAPDSDSDPDNGPPVGALDAALVLSPVISTVGFVTWTPPVEGSSWVEYGLEGEALDKQTPVVATTTVPHEQVILGMKADHTYQWRAVTEVGTARYESPIGSVTTGSPATAASGMTVFTDDRARQDPAPYLLTVTGKPSAVVIYDRDGDVVWSYDVPGTDTREVVTVRPAWDGASLIYGYYDQVQDAAIGGIYRVTMDGRSVIFTSTLSAHHDFVERKDGTFAYLSQEYRVAVPVTGDDCGQLPDCTTADVVADIVLETPEGVPSASAAPPTEVYNHFDDSGDQPFWTCNHMEEDFPAGMGEFRQWTHGNSLIPDPADPENAYWINYRYQDALVRVSRNHELLGIIGGFGSDRSNLDPSIAFDHGHYSHMWPGGFLMFDNNTHDAERTSHVREYSYDPATNGDVQLVHTWTGEEETLGMADARKTSVGTVLLNWAIEKKVQERTVDDEIVWGVSFDDSDPGRIVLLNDLYQLDPPYDYW